MATFSILIASDLSERSDRAMRRGLLLANALNAQVTLVSIIDEDLPDHFATDLLEKTRRHLVACVEELGSTLACTVQVELGDPLTRLVETINANPFDLVVVGRHRKRGLLDDFRRTTVESMIVKSNRPVLLVVDPVHQPYARVLVPSAFSKACTSAAAVAGTLAPDAEMRLCHVWLAPFQGLTGGETSDVGKAEKREAVARAKAWAATLPGEAVEVELVHGPVGAGVQDEVTRFKPDLLAVGAHTRSASFSGLGSFTSDLVRDPPVDVLVTRGV